jgi:hypothetical protein
MRTLVLECVSPEQLASPEPLVRLFAEKTLSYNAGILHALQAVLSSEEVRPGQGRNRKQKSLRHTSGSGRSRTKI